MARMDDGASRVEVVLTARHIIAQHNTGARCASCPDDPGTCPQLRWARRSSPTDDGQPQPPPTIT